jgi:tetratricopeptide (TPR) repeat protein
VHASNEARFEQSFRDIADQLKIPGRQDPKANIFRLVENWLRDEKNGKWICILDNADDDKFLCSLPAAKKGALTKELSNASTKPLLEYVPRSRNGFTIITSRSREVALKMVKHTDLIPVNPMERSEALELLQKTLDQPGESQESQQLVEELECMPLAIVQAASYIRERGTRYSVAQYLRDFRKSDREATNLLKKEAGHLDRDWEAKNSIFTTWQISFDYIRREKPSAAELVSLMSFFDRQGIPEDLIRPRPSTHCTARTEISDDSSDGETSECGSDGGPDFEDDVTTLRNYSFILVDESGTSFTMHRLMQLTTRAWLKSYGEIERWRERFICNLSDEFPTGQYENWGRCRSLFPHVRAAISQRPESREPLLRWATLLYRGAWYASQSGNIADARDMASKSHKQRLKLLGAQAEEALASTAMLAEAYALEGRWDEAEQLQVQVMETRKTKLGADHPDTLMSMANLASTYLKQGRWDEAEQLFVEVMETRRAKLGVDHPDTLTSMANLALTYLNQGRWDEAEQLFVQVMETRRIQLGVDHPDTLTSMANLTSTYWNQGRWAEAEQIEVQVMEARKIKLGADHPDTLTSMANLASTYWNQGRWAEAEQIEVQVMETRKIKLGVDHPDTLASMANLASTYLIQGRWEEAEQLQLQVLETSKAKLGGDHPDTLRSMANLAFTWKSSGHNSRALGLLRDCLAKQRQILGLNHPVYVSNSQTLLAWETEMLNL